MLTSDYNRVAPWVAEHANCSIPDKGAAVGMTNGLDEIVAGVLYENFTGASITATIAIKPGVMVPKSFIGYIFEYPFNELNVRKMFAMIAEHNEPSIEFVERCGFTQENRIKDYFENGDLLVFSCTPESCRWLKE